jgi:hypothetical protein
MHQILNRSTRTCQAPTVRISIWWERSALSSRKIKAKDLTSCCQGLNHISERCRCFVVPGYICLVREAADARIISAVLVLSA